MRYLFNKLKYSLAYLIPAFCLLGFLLGGLWTWSTVIFAFVLTPILDFTLPTSAETTETRNKSYAKVYDWFLYLNLFWVYGLIFYSGLKWSSSSYTSSENIGLVLSLGLVLGTCGINVAHELGHRTKKTEIILAQLLLLPSFYMHFYIEHNRGHHLRVATPADPASAKKHEILYLFWFRSILFSYLSAWEIQLKMIKGKAFLSFSNKMLWFTLITSSYLFAEYFLFGFKPLLYLTVSGIVGILLLESINYIEHYGLRRLKKEDGKYEKVQAYHSWNANYTFGRIILFELTRHSDHHYKASKKYHTLSHQQSAPELPFGYPAAILCSLVPWLWFKTMDKRI